MRRARRRTGRLRSQLKRMPAPAEITAMPIGGIWPEEPACCLRWLNKLEPRERSEGTRDERHTCPTCKRTYVVTFTCVLKNGQLSSRAVNKRVATTLRLPGRIPA